MCEVYMVARGQSRAVVEDNKIEQCSGDVLIVEPGEVHTLTHGPSAPLHVVVQTPFSENDKEIVE
jgi:quercetin dioxygenase-like cupin family protein